MKGAIALALSLLAWSCARGGQAGAADSPGEESSPVATAAVRDEDPAAQPHTGSETLTKGFWGLSDELARHGIEVTVGSTNIYQTNATGGLGTHQQSGRFTGTYDVQVATDVEKLLGLKGLGLFVHGEGGWPETAGIDEDMVGSVLGVNADALGRRSLDIVEVFLEWNPFEGLLTVKAGKIDFAGVFDASEYANDETSQFLNGALVNNPTIPIPDYCLGVILSAHLTDRWSVAAGVGDGEANGRTTGFRTTFDGDDYLFYALETDLRTELSSSHGPLTGNVRFGLWYDPQPKARSGSDEAYRNDVGVYTSVDQVLLKENGDPEDSQGLGAFARLGCTDPKRNDMATFWSTGVQYQGLWRGRDDDVLGLGVAQGLFSQEASSPFTDDYESVLELYYRIQVAPWVAISPSAQYVANPGGNGAAADAVVVGVRAQIVF